VITALRVPDGPDPIASVDGLTMLSGLRQLTVVAHAGNPTQMTIRFDFVDARQAGRAAGSFRKELERRKATKAPTMRNVLSLLQTLTYTVKGTQVIGTGTLPRPEGGPQ